MTYFLQYAIVSASNFICFNLPGEQEDWDLQHQAAHWVSERFIKCLTSEFAWFKPGLRLQGFRADLTPIHPSRQSEEKSALGRSSVVHQKLIGSADISLRL